MKRCPDLPGKPLPFKVKGLSVVRGGSRRPRPGRVFNLKKIEDFNGLYVAGTVQGTIAAGAGETALKNLEKGVVIYLSPTKGINLKLAGEGVNLHLGRNRHKYGPGPQRKKCRGTRVEGRGGGASTFSTQLPLDPILSPRKVRTNHELAVNRYPVF